MATPAEDREGAAMSEQRGLRNPDTHGTTSDGEPYCESCGVCDEGWRCRCCLAAEVEALRARNETLIATIQRQDSTFERQMEEHEELEALRAQVQRVRDACVSSHVDDKGKKVVFLDRIQRALDGGDAEPELDISISSYAKEADDGEVGWNDGGDA